MSNLYDLPLESPEFIRPCGCNQGSDDTDTCILVAPIPGAKVTSYAVSTTSSTDRTPIRATEEELDNFASAWVRRRGLTV
jgi:hypothetical protein